MQENDVHYVKLMDNILIALIAISKLCMQENQQIINRFTKFISCNSQSGKWLN